MASQLLRDGMRSRVRYSWTYSSLAAPDTSVAQAVEEPPAIGTVPIVDVPEIRAARLS
jgi:hypothetical protein